MNDERDSSSCFVDGSCMQVNKSITERCWQQVGCCSPLRESDVTGVVSSSQLQSGSVHLKYGGSV